MHASLHRRTTPALVTALLLVGILVAIAPAAEAHAAAKPMPWETRILHDNKDDHGGDKEVTTQSGHELHALDLQELYDEARDQDVIHFRIVFDGGWSSATVGDKPTLRDVVTFKADGEALEFAFTTDDNEAFSGTFDAVSVEPEHVYNTDEPDRNRRVLVGVLERAAHGLDVGTELTDFQVVSYSGDNEGDVMGEDDPDDGTGTWFVAAGYEVAGPVQYASLEVTPASIATQVGTNETIFIDIVNLIDEDDLGKSRQAQEITVAAVVPDGFDASLHLQEYRPLTFTRTWERGEEQQVHLFFEAPEPVEGTVFVGITTDKGGSLVKEVPVTVTAATEDGNETEDATETETHTETGTATDDANATEDEGTPGQREVLPGPALGVVLLGILLWTGRRRR